MPALGIAQETGKLVRWLKAEGEPVGKGESVMEVETDKVTVEVESPADGVLAAVRASEGDEVPVGQVLAYLLAPGEDVPVEAPAPEPVATAASAARGDGDTGGPAPSSRRRLASPKARRLARERGIDLERVTGSGPGGAIVASDLSEPPAPSRQQSLGPVWTRMAERVAASWQEVPHFYLQHEIDASRLLAWLEHARARDGYERATLTDLLVKVAAEALARHRYVNASWQDGAIVRHEEVNVGIAVALDDGLIVPVVQGANRLRLREIVEGRARLVEAARAGELRPEDVHGGTFTISNLGARGAVDVFHPIVNAPQAAMLAVGRIMDRVVPVDGRAGVRPILGLTVAFDHRVVVGASGADFLEAISSLLEEPAGLVD